MLYFWSKFRGQVLIFKSWLYQGNINPERGIEIARSYIVNFFDRYLQRKSINLLKDVVYPEAHISKN